MLILKTPIFGQLVGTPQSSSIAICQGSFVRLHEFAGTSTRTLFPGRSVSGTLGQLNSNRWRPSSTSARGQKEKMARPPNIQHTPGNHCGCRGIYVWDDKDRVFTILGLSVKYPQHIN